VQRFLDSASSEHVHAGTKLLVSGFLRAMQAENIYFKYGMHPLMPELMMKGAVGRFDSQRIGAGGLLSAIGDDEEMGGGDERVVVEPVEVAVETCAIRMSKLLAIPGVSRGISFGMDRKPEGPNSCWSIVLHRGPLPLLQIELSDITRFRPPKQWVDSVIESNCAHVISRKGGPSLGGGDHLFLWLKRYKLFPYSKGNASTEAVTAGQRLRKWCRKVWQEQGGSAETLYKLSSWQWRRKRFVRRFDRVLTQHVGSENLNATLKEMDTRLESWLPACEN
jgi:hypothetical protein